MTAQVNSSAALRLLQQRLVHVAGTHLKDEGGGEPNRAAIGAAFPRRGVAVFAFEVWEEGLVVARGNSCPVMVSMPSMMVRSTGRAATMSAMIRGMR